MATPIKQLLTIAGSDSGGGAGIQADLRTWAALNSYGASVITALTAQNTRGVDAVAATDPAFVRQQLRSVLSDLQFSAIKTGMLSNSKVIEEIVAVLKEEKNLPPLVVDPVMVSTSGHTLLEADAIETLKTSLLPLALLVTPNLPEGRILAGLPKDGTGQVTQQELKDLAKKISQAGPPYVLLKGGHIEKETEIYDVLYNAKADSYTVLAHDRLSTTSTHGTGCTLSAAICAYLAKGLKVEQATKKAVEYVQSALVTATPIGSGNGPVNHLHPLVHRAVYQTSSSSPLWDRLLQDNANDWGDFVANNEFIQGVKKGTLPLQSFVHFLKQDYIYLLHYARAFAARGAKAPNFKVLQTSTDVVVSILKEVNFHRQYCARFGAEITEDELEDMGTVAYTRYLLDVANSMSYLHFLVAVSPCFQGYAVIGRTLYNDPETVKGDSNPYWSWIQEYASDWFQGAASESMKGLEEIAHDEGVSESLLADLSKTFNTATRMETAFFEQSCRPSVVQGKKPVVAV